VPVLGHSTWHLYRKVVKPEPDAHAEHLRPHKRPDRRRYAAQFPAALLGGEDSAPPNQ